MISKKTIALSSIPILIAAVYIYLFGLNIPFLDQWSNVDLLMKQQDGTLSIRDFFMQHNEHRPFFPRLIWLFLANITQYNNNTQLWVNLLIMIGTFIFFVSRAIKLWQDFDVQVPSLIIPLISLLVFNLGQFESWLQGFQTIMFLGMACVMVGLFLLAGSTAWKIFWIALLLGVVATFSMANGMLYWVIGVIVLLFTAPQKLKVVRTSLWSICGGLCIWLFLTGWRSSNLLDITYVISHPTEWLTWLLNFLGAPLVFSLKAWVPGLASVILYTMLVVHIIKTRQWKPLLPFIALVLFILITAVTTSLGRMKLGMPQAIVSRYLTMSAWYWAVLIVLLPLLRLKPAYLQSVLSFIAIFHFILNMTGWRNGYTALYQRILPAYQTAKAGQPISDDVLSQISSSPAFARSRLEFLREYKLSVYAEEEK